MKVYGLCSVCLASDVFVVGKGRKFPVGGFDSSGYSLSASHRRFSVSYRMEKKSSGSSCYSKGIPFVFFLIGKNR